MIPEISSPSPFPPLMCKKRANTMATDPQPRPSSRLGRSSDAITSSAAGSSFPTAPASSSSQSSNSKASSAISSHASLSSLRDSLPENPTFYPFAEICSATNNFLSKRLSSSSSSWRCSLRNKDAVVFQRAFRGDAAALPARLSAVCKSHHSSLVRLLGASLGGDYIYLVYEYIAGANLEECLRNPRNPNFTTLSKWISRMQVATDLAQGLEYIHYHSAVGGVPPSVPPDHGRTRGTVHNRIKSSSIIITEPNFNAKICHFGAAELAGEIPTAADEAEEEGDRKSKETSEAPSPMMKRSDSRRLKINGTWGYMAPEVLAGGSISQRSDVFSFGVVLLELLTGQEPLKYKFDRATKDYERISLIETARDAIGTEDEDGALEAEAEERRGRIRRWVDRRLRDSYPVDVAEKLIRVGLRCVEAEPWMRPDMTWVAGKVSKLFLDSKAWGEKVRVPTDFSVSLAPR